MSCTRPPMRGLTLVELVLALSMLSAVVVASAAWIRLVSQTTVKRRAQLSWHSTASATLQLIADDLAAGDVLPGDKNPPTVSYDGSTLTIPTRSPPIGPCLAAYHLDPIDDTLYRRIISASDAEDQRPILPGVGGWEVELEPDRGVFKVVLEAPRIGDDVRMTVVSRCYAIRSGREDQ